MASPVQVDGRGLSSWLLPVLAGAAALAVVGVVGVIDVVTAKSAGDMVRDPSTTAGLPWWTGAGAMLNATLWGIAAALGAFVASLHRSHRGTLLLFAGLSAVLMVEDTLQIKTLGFLLGVPEEWFLLLYACAGLALAWLLRPSRAGTGGWTLLAAGALLGLSIIADVARGIDHPELILIEFGPMLVGTAVWACVPVMLYLWLTRAAADGELVAATDGGVGGLRSR